MRRNFAHNLDQQVAVEDLWWGFKIVDCMSAQHVCEIFQSRAVLKIKP